MSEYFGIYIGKVIDNNDEQKMGRLKVRNEFFEDWAFPRNQINFGENTGVFTKVPIGSTVLISFINGHVEAGMWEFAPWQKEQAPEVEEGKVYIGNNEIDLKQLLSDLFDILSTAKTPTSLGLQPFNPETITKIQKFKTDFEKLF